MAARVLVLVLWKVIFISAYGNYYFATHESYKSSTYKNLGYLTLNVSGNIGGVTQQCRRNCVSQSKCGAYNISLLSGSEDLGAFTCRFFVSSACYWQGVSLKPTPVSTFFQIWEKLDARQYNKPKSCLEYCQVQFKGNCTACRGYDNLSGPDCDIAPRLCSDYNVTDPNWRNGVSLWPWGFYGRKLSASCKGRRTRFLLSKDAQNSSRIVNSLGWDTEQLANDKETYLALMKRVDWETISAVVGMSQEKGMSMGMSLGTNLAIWVDFSGLQISPLGALSLIRSLNSPPTTGFPTPLPAAPFVIHPDCGAFWQFNSATPICNQRSVLLNFDAVRWDTLSYTTYNQISVLLN